MGKNPSFLSQVFWDITKRLTFIFRQISRDLNLDLTNTKAECQVFSAKLQFFAEKFIYFSESNASTRKHSNLTKGEWWSDETTSYNSTEWETLIFTRIETENRRLDVFKCMPVISYQSTYRHSCVSGYIYWWLKQIITRNISLTGQLRYSLFFSPNWLLTQPLDQAF